MAGIDGSTAMLRRPALSPDASEIAFAHAGDVWVAPAEGGTALRITSHPSEDYSPAFSPDGESLAFFSGRTGGGNIYVASLNGDAAPRRVTYHGGASPPLSWSPDGAWLYFGSHYTGIGGGIYKIAAAGGPPIRVAHDPMESHYNVAVSPDGARVAFNNNGQQWWRHGHNPAGHSDIWVMAEAADADDYRRLTAYLGLNTRPMWGEDGETTLYVSDRGGEENIWQMSLDGDDDATPVTEFTEGRVTNPSISADGRWIAFERDFRLWRLNVADGAAEPVDTRLHADEKSTPVRHETFTDRLSEFDLSADGEKVAFVVHGEVFADLADKGDKVKKGGDSFRITDTHARESQLLWHPDSEHVVYVSDRTGHNEVFLYDFKLREERQLTDSAEGKAAPTFSPDGKWLAYTVGKTDIRLMDAEEWTERPFIVNERFTGVVTPTDFVWSPDSQWVAYVATDANFFDNVHVQNVDERESRQVTFLSNISCGGPLWSPDGKFLVFGTGQYREESLIARVDLVPIAPVFTEDDFHKLFEEDEKDEDERTPDHPESGDAAAETEDDETSDGASGDEEQKDDEEAEPEPVRIDTDGIKHRVRFLTDPKAGASAMRIRPDSKTLVYRASHTGQTNLWSLSLEEGKDREPPKQLTSSAGGKGAVRFVKDGKRFYFLESGRIHSSGMDEAGGRDGDPKTLNVRAEVEIDFHAEKMQAFDEAWRFMNENFYDAEFHGCDWDAARETFRARVEGARTGDEFRELLNLMVGELNASHLGAGGGGSGAPDAFLGLEFDRAELEQHGRYRITSVLPDSPVTFDEEPARVGEYLLAVDGNDLGDGPSLSQRLQRLSGRRVTLALGDETTADDAREIVVKPISGGRHSELRYRGWVRANTEYVHEKSGGRLGYAHVSQMSYPAYMRLIADLDAESHSREGIVVDVRFNGGGHIAPFILDVLARKAYTLSSLRGHYEAPDTNLAGNRIVEKPLILITNEHSGSNTEMFSEGFRRLGLGTIVGKPTAGAVIWTWGWQLLDGTSFRLPRMRVGTLDGENLEGAARPVDIDVDRPLGEAARGVDSQLDTAVSELVAQIDADA
ncbi:peptidase S41 [Candidatus Poribacteria bacterium]|nr:peptidase S41 [Candidatus Poribacteria bacterium]